MLTDQEIRAAFLRTNTSEPAEGWPGLERFAREIERIISEKSLMSDRQMSEAFNSGDGTYRP